MASDKDSKGRILKQNEDQLTDGRYRFRYTDSHGNRKAVYSWKLVPTDKIPIGKRNDISLREKEKEIEKDLDDGINLNDSNLLLNELFERYLSTKAKLALSTKNNYIHLWEKNVKDKIGFLKVVSTKKSDILQYYSYLYKERHFSIGTIQLYQNILYPAFQLAVDDNVIRTNPCKNCMKDYIKNNVSSKNALTRKEQETLLNFIQNDSFYYPRYNMVAFMLSTGCRIGEVLGLTWEDIDFENKCINIDHQVIYKKKEDKIQFYSAPPKNRTDRQIPLQTDIISILKTHMEETYFLSKSSGFVVEGFYDERDLKKKSRDFSNFVFINRDCKIYTPNSIVRAFHGISDAYNRQEIDNAYFEERDPFLLSDFSPHTLRHTYCTRMAENGIDVKVLQEIMGHKNIGITMKVYNHVSFERSQKAVNECDSVLNIKAI